MNIEWRGWKEELTDSVKVAWFPLVLIAFFLLYKADIEQYKTGYESCIKSIYGSSFNTSDMAALPSFDRLNSSAFTQPFFCEEVCKTQPRS